MPTPRHLTWLVAIADHGRVGAAGAAVRRSRSAVTLAAKAPEERLVTAIVARFGPPVAAQPDGEALVRVALVAARGPRRLRQPPPAPPSPGG
jgi:DNA-binding transcriptional LysR family regulator